MKNYLLIFSMVAVAACNDNGNEQHTTDVVTETPNTEVPADSTGITRTLEGCYMKFVKRDTVFLQLSQSGNQLHGKMAYDNYEKDSSHGLVEGTVEDDILRLWYSFDSEGMHSVTEQVFRVKDNGLILATGQPSFKNDSAYYPDIASLHFDEDNTLKKTACSQLPAYVRE